MKPEWREAVGRWSPPQEWVRITSVDAHTEGEPLRVVLSGLPELTGPTILDRRKFARLHHDDLRRTLMWEPRGHADMYGCLVLPPVSESADIGVLFTHNEGFSTMCGHGIIGVTTVLVECGLLEVEDGGSVGIDTPAGFVSARPAVVDGRVDSVSFTNVPSFVERLDAEVHVPEVGKVRYDLAFGGAFYAYVDAADFGLELVPSETDRIIALGRAIKDAVQQVAPPAHPENAELSFMYGTIFVGAAASEGNHSRNVCVFAEGEVDRCPTGTGVSGRLAIHNARGQVACGEAIVIESILGTTFRCQVLGETTVEGLSAVVPEVTGRAWITGRHEFLVAPDDPLRDGFLLR